MKCVFAFVFSSLDGGTSVAMAEFRGIHLAQAFGCPSGNMELLGATRLRSSIEERPRRIMIQRLKQRQVF